MPPPSSATSRLSLALEVAGAAPPLLPLLHPAMQPEKILKLAREELQEHVGCGTMLRE
jgi:hypothetical protein